MLKYFMQDPGSYCNLLLSPVTSTPSRHHGSRHVGVNSKDVIRDNVGQQACKGSLHTTNLTPPTPFRDSPRGGHSRDLPFLAPLRQWPFSAGRVLSPVENVPRI